MASVAQDIKEIKQKIKIITEELEQDRFLTASWLIKKLAVWLDGKGYGTKLETLMKKL